MRIALAIMDMHLPGGAEHDVMNLSAGLRAAGHEPIVITEGGPLCKEIEALGVPVVYCPLGTRNPIGLRRNAAALAAIIEERRIDVLNPQGVYPAVSAYWATRRLRKKGLLVPNVVTIHMLGRLTWWYYRLGSAVLNHVADHIIVESDCERLRLQRGGMRRPVSVLYNCFPSAKVQGGPDSPAEIRRRMGWPEDKVVFLMPARMSPEKGHDVLFQALAAPAMADVPALFYLAGEGPLLQAHQAAVQSLGLASKVVFGGFRRDVHTLLRGADVFLLCSRAESLPLSIREAMAASLPVLSTDVGGIAEAVENGRSGILIPPDDPPALAEAIRTLAQDAPGRQAMGRRGREISREKFDYDQWVAGTVAVMSAVGDRMRQEASKR